MDDPLEPLVFECLERHETEGDAAIAAVCARHPDRAEELRARLERLRGMGLLGMAPPAGAMPERLGDFRLIRRLGGGGMGVVYLAEQESLRREVALKLIRPEQLFFGGSRERFRREVEAAARLSHPGIVTVFQVGEAQGIPYFAMERIQGCTLGEILADLAGRDPRTLRGTDLIAVLARRLGAPAPARPAALFEGSWAATCVRIVLQVALALEHAHARGVIHRDVKPSNVMLTLEGRVLLLDFGLARAQGATRITLTGSTLGSLPYLPPEQARGSKAEPDPATDIYSLGVTLYELLALVPPFLGADLEATRALILAARPVRLRSRNPSVSWDAETVCQRAMAPEAARRYGSAALFAQDLQAVLDLRPVQARRPGPVLLLLRFVRRNPALAAALLLAALLFLGVPTGLLVYERGLRARADWAAYTGNLAAAAGCVRNFETNEARRLLQACPPAHRGFEWRHLLGCTDTARAVWREHQAPVECLALRSDGTLCASGDLQGEIVVRELPSGSVRHRLRRPDAGDVVPSNAPHGAMASADGVFSLVFAPDGGRLAAGFADGEVRLFDVNTGAVLEPALRHRRPGVVAALGCARAGLRLVSACSGGEVLVWEPDQDRVLLRTGDPRQECYAADLSPDGEKAAAGFQDRKVRVWRVADGSLIETLEGPAEQITGLTFAPDGERIVVSCVSGVAHCWDLTQKRGDPTLRCSSLALSAVTVSADGLVLVTGAEDRVVRLHELATLRPIAEHRGHEGSVRAVACSPDRRWLVSASWDRTVRLWPMDAPDFLQVDHSPDPGVLGLAPLPDGRTVATGDLGGQVALWDTATGARRRALAEGLERVLSVAAAPGGERAAAGDASGQVHVWSLTDPSQHLTVPVASVPILALRFLPGGTTLLAASQDGQLQAVDAVRGTVAHAFPVHPAAVSAVDLSPDGLWAATACHDGQVRLWQVRHAHRGWLAEAMLERALTGHEGQVHAVRFAPDGRTLASAGSDRTVRIWDLTHGECRLVLRGHDQSVRCLGFLPDGSRLFSGGMDRSLRVWDPARGDLLCTLRPHRSWIAAIAVAPDGAAVFTASNDGSVGVWAAGR